MTAIKLKIGNQRVFQFSDKSERSNYRMVRLPINDIGSISIIATRDDNSGLINAKRYVVTDLTGETYILTKQEYKEIATALYNID